MKTTALRIQPKKVAVDNIKVDLDVGGKALFLKDISKETMYVVELGDVFQILANSERG